MPVAVALIAGARGPVSGRNPDVDDDLERSGHADRPSRMATRIHFRHLSAPEWDLLNPCKTRLTVCLLGRVRGSIPSSPMASHSVDVDLVPPRVAMASADSAAGAGSSSDQRRASVNWHTQPFSARMDGAARRPDERQADGPQPRSRSWPATDMAVIPPPICRSTHERRSTAAIR